MLSRRTFLQAIFPALTVAHRRLGAAEQTAGAPYLQDVCPDRATICWTSAEPETSTVVYTKGDVMHLASQVRVSAIAPPQSDPLYLHEAVIDELAPGAEYSYGISADRSLFADGKFRFRTPASGPIKFIVFGDSGTGLDEQLQLAPRMLLERPDLALHTGDLAYPVGTLDAYRNYYFSPYREMMSSIPFYPCPGNHDYADDRPDAYRALMRVPIQTVPGEGRGLYYSFDWGDAHFVSLDTNEPLERAAEGNGSMLDWLDADLRRSRSRWKIVFFHHTPYGTGRYATAFTTGLVRRLLVPILERNGVQVVFAGHEHNYQRSHAIRDGAIDAARGTVYITTGGGGGGLYPVVPGPLQAVGLTVYHFVSVEIDGDRLYLRAIGPDGGQLDAVTLQAV